MSEDLPHHPNFRNSSESLFTPIDPFQPSIAYGLKNLNLRTPLTRRRGSAMDDNPLPDFLSQEVSIPPAGYSTEAKENISLTVTEAPRYIDATIKSENNTQHARYPLSKSATTIESHNASSHRSPSSKEEAHSTSYLFAFIIDTLLRQIYLHLHLRLPYLYFSRVTRIFQEAEMSMPEIERMAMEASAKSKDPVKIHHLEALITNPSPSYANLQRSWEFFIDCLLREWKTINLISVLLLSAILTILQIQEAADDPVTRYTAILSLICALMSLLYGCVFIIRFGTMRTTYKAVEWASEAQQSETSIFWNVWVLLAMPTTWLAWSIIMFCVCIMSFVWRTGTTEDANRQPLTQHAARIPRIIITVVFVLGGIYFALVARTLRRYGEEMDQEWQKKIKDWIHKKVTQVEDTVQETVRHVEDTVRHFEDTVRHRSRSPSSNRPPGDIKRYRSHQAVSSRDSIASDKSFPADIDISVMPPSPPSKLMSLASSQQKYSYFEQPSNPVQQSTLFSTFHQIPHKISGDNEDNEINSTIFTDCVAGSTSQARSPGGVRNQQVLSYSRSKDSVESEDSFTSALEIDVSVMPPSKPVSTPLPLASPHQQYSFVKEPDISSKPVQHKSAPFSSLRQIPRMITRDNETSSASADCTAGEDRHNMEKGLQVAPQINVTKLFSISPDSVSTILMLDKETLESCLLGKEDYEKLALDVLSESNGNDDDTTKTLNVDRIKHVLQHWNDTFFFERGGQIQLCEELFMLDIDDINTGTDTGGGHMVLPRSSARHAIFHFLWKDELPHHTDRYKLNSWPEGLRRVDILHRLSSVLPVLSAVNSGDGPSQDRLSLFRNPDIQPPRIPGQLT